MPTPICFDPYTGELLAKGPAAMPFYRKHRKHMYLVYSDGEAPGWKPDRLASPAKEQDEYRILFARSNQGGAT